MQGYVKDVDEVELNCPILEEKSRVGDYQSWIVREISVGKGSGSENYAGTEPAVRIGGLLYRLWRIGN